MEQQKNYQESPFDKTSYIKNIDQKFSEIKQKHPDRVEKCLQAIIEKDINDRIDFFYNRAPKEITKALKELTEEQMKEFAIKDLIIDNIILPEDEEMRKEEISRLGLGKEANKKKSNYRERIIR